MIIPFVFLLAIGAGQSAPIPDQTSDALVVSKFLAAVRDEAGGNPGSLLSSPSFVGDYARRERRSMDEFVVYARGCQLKKIEIINSRDRAGLPLSVQWQCRYPEPDRYASFWVEDGLISRVSWGPPLTVEWNGPPWPIPVPPAQPSERR